MDFIAGLRADYRSSRGLALPCCVCGDFNAAPHDAPSYPSLAVPVMVQAGHRSAYGLHDGGYTTWKWRPDGNGGEKEVKHMIDYIWYADDGPGPRLVSEALLSLPTAEELGPDALPCAAYPSDHLAIAARVALVQPAS